MQRYVVLPRGINVGRANRIAMGPLRMHLTDAGYRDVATVGQSGNIVLSAPDEAPHAIAHAVQTLLRTAFAASVHCAVRTGRQLETIAAQNPFAELATDGSRYLVAFLDREVDPAAARAYGARVEPPEAVQIIGQDAYIWHPDGVLAMTSGSAVLEKQFSLQATARNWNTIEKLIAVL